MHLPNVSEAKPGQDTPRKMLFYFKIWEFEKKNELLINMTPHCAVWPSYCCHKNCNSITNIIILNISQPSKWKKKNNNSKLSRQPLGFLGEGYGVFEEKEPWQNLVHLKWLSVFLIEVFLWPKSILTGQVHSMALPDHKINPRVSCKSSILER